MNSLNPALSLDLFPAGNSQSDLSEARPPQSFESSDRAQRLKQLLLDLSKEDEYTDYRSILRSAAVAIREKAYGHNRAAVKRRISRLFAIPLNAGGLTASEIADETNVPLKEIKAAIKELVEGNIIRAQPPRRDYHQIGTHFYETVYEPVK